MLNALGRIIAGYDERIENNRKDLAVAENQLNDYQVRFGKPFLHDEYLEKLTVLRDRLKLALSGTAAEGEPTAADLGAEIKRLRAVQVIESAPVRAKAAPRPEPVRRRVDQPPPTPPEEEKSVTPPPADEPAGDAGEPQSRFRDQIRRRSVQKTLF